MRAGRGFGKREEKRNRKIQKREKSCGFLESIKCVGRKRDGAHRGAVSNHIDLASVAAKPRWCASSFPSVGIFHRSQQRKQREEARLENQALASAAFAFQPHLARRGSQGRPGGPTRPLSQGRIGGPTLPRPRPPAQQPTTAISRSATVSSRHEIFSSHAIADRRSKITSQPRLEPSVSMYVLG